MTASVIMDIAILAVIAVFGALGWKRGLLRTLSELAVVVLSLVLASQVSVFAARYVVDKVLRPAAEDAVREQVTVIANETSRTAREQVSGVLEAIPNNFVRNQAQALLEKTALPDRAETAGRDALLTAALQLTDRTLNTVVYSFAHSLLYAASFALIHFILRLIVRALNLAAKLPGLRELNQAGGLALGVGKGVILAFLCVWILSRTSILPPEVIEGSVLAGLAGNLLKQV